MSKAGSKLSISQKIATLDESVEWFYSEEFSLDQKKNHHFHNSCRLHAMF